MPRKHYDTNLTDLQWALLKKYLPKQMELWEKYKDTEETKKTPVKLLCLELNNLLPIHKQYLNA